ncbi:LOW QUALITY PROTEIN: hypothetical protein V2J09_009048 [Rumex salicifolius]
MAKTRTNGPPSPPPSPPPNSQNQTPAQIDISQQLAAIASRLEQLDGLALKVASLESKALSNHQTTVHEGLAETSHRGEVRGKFRQSAPPNGRARPPWWNDPPEEEEGWRGFSHQRRQRAKIDFPKFEGGDRRGWILKAEKYFHYFDVADESKVEVAAMHLEGDALDLYAWVNGEDEILAWEDLIQVFQESYGPPEFQNPDEFLCAIRQTGTVAEYRLEFARRAARVKEWPESALLGACRRFEGRVEGRVYKATSLALEYETKLGQMRSPTKPHTFSRSTAYPTSRPYSHPSNRPAPSAATNSNERLLRREQGLCFRCGAKYSPGHQCKSSLAQLEFTNGEVETGEESEEQSQEDSKVEISFHQISGSNISSTLRLRGTIEGRSVLILVDSGSTHNFISAQLAASLGLETKEVPMFGVTIGNGAIISCDRICPDVAIQLPGVILRQDFFAFDMGTAELVLGVCWLASLNTVEANWKELFLTFRQQGRENSGADALSRRPHSAELLTLVVPFALDFHQWKNALLRDPFTAEILKNQNSTSPNQPHFTVVDGRETDNAIAFTNCHVKAQMVHGESPFIRIPNAKKA